MAADEKFHVAGLVVRLLRARPLVSLPALEQRRQAPLRIGFGWRLGGRDGSDRRRHRRSVDLRTPPFPRLFDPGGLDLRAGDGQGQRTTAWVAGRQVEAVGGQQGIDLARDDPGCDERGASDREAFRFRQRRGVTPEALRHHARQRDLTLGDCEFEALEPPLAQGVPVEALTEGPLGLADLPGSRAPDPVRARTLRTACAVPFRWPGSI